MLDWPEFIGYDDAQLANADIASLNFSCARGLPGMEKYDAAQSLRLLDEMARRVAWTTQAQTSVFINRPDQFYNSYDYFRALVLITVIQRDFGVRYDQAKLPDHVPFVPDDSFLHRVIHTKLGTCANMPVLYIAVGRRLGYPMKLVRAKGETRYTFSHAGMTTPRASTWKRPTRACARRRMITTARADMPLRRTRKNWVASSSR